MSPRVNSTPNPGPKRDDAGSPVLKQRPCVAGSGVCSSPWLPWLEDLWPKNEEDSPASLHLFVLVNGATGFLLSLLSPSCPFTKTSAAPRNGGFSAPVKQMGLLTLAAVGAGSVDPTSEPGSCGSRVSGRAAECLFPAVFRCVSRLVSSNRFFFYYYHGSPQKCFGGCFASWPT